MPRLLRVLLRQLIIVIPAVVLALAAAEMIARHRYPQLRYRAERLSRPEDTFLRFDAHLGWVHIPGRTARFRRAEFDTRITINEDGFRGPPLPKERTAGRTRMLLLGDSFAFGHGVEDDETTSAVLERLRPDLEVVNLGVSGYSTDQEWLLLQEQGFEWHPDIVVLMICGNDLLDNGKETAWGVYWKPRFLLEGDSLRLERETLPEKVPWGMRIRRELNRRFVLYEILAFRWASFQAQREGRGPIRVMPGNESFASRSPAEQASARELTRRLLDAMYVSCVQHGARFLVVVLPGFPAPEVFDGFPSGAGSHPADRGGVLDLGPVFSSFQEAHPDTSLTFTYDSHWPPAGHRLTARAIQHAIEERGWLKGTGEPHDQEAAHE